MRALIEWGRTSVKRTMGVKQPSFRPVTIAIWICCSCSYYGTMGEYYTSWAVDKKTEIESSLKRNNVTGNLKQELLDKMKKRFLNIVLQYSYACMHGWLYVLNRPSVLLAYA